ncbi:hypothetical protein ACVRW4_02640 [Streptococcus phocae subsp. phocae]
MNKKKFPLVADGDPVISMAKPMALYDNEDLITNIRGDYHDKAYDDEEVTLQPSDDTSNAPTSTSSPTVTRSTSHQGHRNYTNEARQKAKQDIKEKRKAYITKKIAYSPKQTAAVKTTKNPSREKKATTELHRFSEKLQQDSYILAELPRQYKEPEQSQSKQAAIIKNNYDFLKRSQIYNPKETKEHRDKIVAQELNLSRLKDIT